MSYEYCIIVLSYFTYNIVLDDPAAEWRQLSLGHLSCLRTVLVNVPIGNRDASSNNVMQSSAISLLHNLPTAVEDVEVHFSTMTMAFTHPKFAMSSRRWDLLDACFFILPRLRRITVVFNVCVDAFDAGYRDVSVSASVRDDIERRLFRCMSESIH